MGSKTPPPCPKDTWRPHTRRRRPPCPKGGVRTLIISALRHIGLLLIYNMDQGDQR